MGGKGHARVREGKRQRRLKEGGTRVPVLLAERRHSRACSWGASMRCREQRKCYSQPSGSCTWLPILLAVGTGYWGANSWGCPSPAGCGVGEAEGFLQAEPDPKRGRCWWVEMAEGRVRLLGRAARAALPTGSGWGAGRAGVSQGIPRPSSRRVVADPASWRLGSPGQAGRRKQ